MKEWLSVHIFYYDNQDTLLTQCIAPLISTCKKREWVARAFFIRYWQGGPHVRLRMYGDSKVLEEKVKPLLEFFIYSYLKQCPSTLVLDETQARNVLLRLYELEYGQAKFTPFYSNNSLYYIPYQPEYHRYGDSQGIEVAEAHFDSSTELVLIALKTYCQKPNYKLTIAFKFMLTALLAFQIPVVQIRLFFRRYTELWSNYLPVPLANLENKWHKQYRSLRRSLVSATMVILHQKSEGDGLLTRWWDEMTSTYSKIIALEQTGKLQFNVPWTKENAQSGNTPLFLVTNYLHMTNNRLGITPAQESYLSYLITLTLDEVIEQEVSCKEGINGA